MARLRWLRTDPLLVAVTHGRSQTENTQNGCFSQHPPLTMPVVALAQRYDAGGPPSGLLTWGRGMQGLGSGLQLPLL
ncbi:uncharacterized protein EI97DRAFT_285503 [Westerdykella ornata]|uniref:Uncharacterized protein n=1 Tax=Westerdykella ornata TaxID=318751 RepID=A0A6A6J837_WESOR|nr:uncharacterized protein EI97DRAFT_285503 [Westerdykella ornata]KAF2271369.1 hypothetical protein EI97DRAFT_285503 [Westerdykella ornata]